MSTQLDAEIETIEKQYIAEKKSFTALDIGNELKRKGINVRQREVSPVVREHFSTDIYNGSGYTKTFIPVNNGSQKAFLYFNIENKPEDYTDANQVALPWDPSKPMFPNIQFTDNQNTKNAQIKSLDDSVADDKAISLDSLVGSKNSSVYHASDCTYASRIKKENLVSFNDNNDALNQGYRKCIRD
jgi:hypothetical protein